MAPLLELGPYTFRAWAFVVSFGVVLSWALLVVRTTRLGYSAPLVLLWVLFGFPMGTLAASALALLVELVVGTDPTSLAGRGGGMTALGAMVGCVVFSVLYIRLVFREPAGKLLDAVAFTYPLGLAIGRVGCLLHGCCFGALAGPEVPGFLRMPVAWLHQDTDAGIYHRATPDAWIWNLPLLFSLNAVVALAMTEVLYARRRQLGLAPGVVLCAALLLEVSGRFALEFVRAPGQPPSTTVLGLNPWQSMAGLAAIVVALELIRRQRTQRSGASTIPAPL